VSAGRGESRLTSKGIAWSGFALGIRDYARLPGRVAAAGLDLFAHAAPWHPEFLHHWAGVVRRVADTTFAAGPLRADRWGAPMTALAVTLLLVLAVSERARIRFQDPDRMTHVARFVEAGIAVPILLAAAFGVVASVVAVLIGLVVVLVEVLIVGMVVLFACHLLKALFME
jgi:hypothetical protein